MDDGRWTIDERRVTNDDINHYRSLPIWRSLTNDKTIVYHPDRKRRNPMQARLDMIGLICQSIPDSVKFYKMLGVKVGDLEPDDPYFETTLEGGIRLSWNDIEMIRKIDPEFVEPVGQRIGLAFLCESPEAVDALYAKLTEAGYKGHKVPWDAFWGQRYAHVQDPDGNVVDLFAPLPRE
jgi:uncharacterized glyoxalase superfamily protein PhnB